MAPKENLYLSSQMNVLQTYTLGVFIFLTTILSAQNYKFKHYSTEDGLPHNVCYDLLQDEKGYIWLAGLDGVARFDGTEFYNFNSDRGLKDSDVRALSLDDKGRLWMLSKKGYLHYLSEGKIFSPPTGKVPKGKLTFFNFIDGKLYLGIIKEAGGSECYSCEEKEGGVLCERQFFQEKNKNEFTIGTNREKEIKGKWLPTTSGNLYAYIKGGLYKVEKDRLIVLEANFFKERKIGGAYEDQNGKLWLAGEGGVYHFVDLDVQEIPVKKELVFEQILVKNSQQIFLIDDEQKNFFLLDLGNGISHDLRKEMSIESSPNYLMKDKEENVWLSTDGGGLYCVYESPFVNYSSSSGLGNSFIYDISEDEKGNIVTGTKDGLYALENEQWKPILLNINGDRSPEIWKFRKEPLSNLLYMSTSEGIFYLENLKEKICLPTERNTTNFIAASGGVISLFRDTLFHIYEGCETKAKIWPAIEPTNNFGYCLFVDNKNQLWMGSDDGAFSYNMGLYEQYGTNEGLPDNQVNDIQQDKDGNMWFATETGLAKMSADKSMKTFAEKDGLLSNKCRKILTDENAGVWIASPKGLHYFDENNVVPYNVRTGLVADNINCLFLDSKDRLWIGTSQGISMSKLKNVPEPIPPPSLHLQDILLNGNSIEKSSLNDIPHDSDLELKYAAISFIDSRRLSYQYRMNQDGAWQTTKNRSLVFTDLRPGQYQLEIRAKKFNSVWSEPLQLPFEIDAPWWRKWWVIALFSLGVIALMGSLMYWRIQTVRAREKQKTSINKQLAELELSALQAQMNPHFIFNCLNAIQHYILRNDAEQANDYLGKFSTLMRLVLESSKAKYISLSDEVHLLRLYMDLEQLCYEHKFDYDIKIDKDLDDDEEIPTMLIQPFVENAILHGLLNKEGKGLLEISFKQVDEEQIVCIIEDNGIGREKAKALKNKKHQTHKSRGMNLLKDRVKVLNFIEVSEIKIKEIDLEENGLAKGTRIELLMPIQ